MNGLQSNKHNLAELCKTHDPDVISIQEPRLRSKRNKDISIKLLGYDAKVTNKYGSRYDIVTFFKKRDLDHTGRHRYYS